MSETPASLEVNRRETEGRTVVEVRGEVDLRTSPQLRTQLLDLADQLDGPVLVDLSAVPYMDSSGVGTLVYVKREVERSKRKLVLVGLQPRVRSVLEITHLDNFFVIANSVADAPQS